MIKDFQIGNRIDNEKITRIHIFNYVSSNGYVTKN